MTGGFDGVIILVDPFYVSAVIELVLTCLLSLDDSVDELDDMDELSLSELLDSCFLIHKPS